MEYYIRQDKDADVRGPFTVDELLEGLNIGTIPDYSLASSDISGSEEQLRKYRECDWFPLSEIPELRHLYPPSQLIPNTRAQRPATVGSTVLLLTSALLVGYGSAVQHDWWIFFLALACLWSACENIASLVEQKQKARIG